MREDTRKTDKNIQSVRLAIRLFFLDQFATIYTGRSKKREKKRENQKEFDC